MWITSDGRVHTVWIPNDYLASREALATALQGLSRSQLGALGEELDSLENSIADSLDITPFETSVESMYEGSPPPRDLLAEIDWSSVVNDPTLELGKVELRWRLDLLEVIRQAIADSERE